MTSPARRPVPRSRRLAGLLLAATLAAGAWWPMVVQAQAAGPVGTVAPAPAPGAAPAAPRPRVGLVLSGGGARGGAHIGVLRVLESLKVPVDVIVGTSAGSIVGAAYATGMPLQDIEREMSRLNTSLLFHDLVRTEIPLARKADDDINYVGPEVGIGPNGVSLPKGAVAGVALEGVLRRLTARQSSVDFDRLPIPFRAVATDVTNAQMVVLAQGSLATAIRASMAIPAAVTPVEIDGRLLVDGGISRNLPVDVARALGADVVIAVNIGTPTRKREEIQSLLSVTDQMTRFITALNVEKSLSELRPSDVLITPRLDDLGTADFDRLADAAKAGEAAAQAQAQALAPLAVDAQTFAAFAAVRTQDGRPASRPIDVLRIEGVERTGEAVLRASIESQPGREFDPEVVEADMKRLYGRGDFEHVSYTFDDMPGVGNVLTARVTEKSWGPHYFRFGLGLSSSFNGDAYFTLRATHRATWLNRGGGEWRNDVQVGHVDLLRTEFLQPLTERHGMFVATHGQLVRTPFDLYDTNGLRVARFRWDRRELGVSAGWPVGVSGEVRTGLLRGRAKLLTDTSLLPGSLLVPDVDTGGAYLRLRLDTLDNLRFPRGGLQADATLYRSLGNFGADFTYTKLALSMRGAIARGNHVLRLAAHGADRLGGGDLPDDEVSSLGGFLNLSGYRNNEFFGPGVRFARAIYTWRIAGPGFLDGAYLGVSAEAGRIGDDATRAGTRHGNAVYVSVDTLLGPVYLGYGRASSRHQAIYVFLGQP